MQGQRSFENEAPIHRQPVIGEGWGEGNNSDLIHSHGKTDVSDYGPRDTWF